MLLAFSFWFGTGIAGARYIKWKLILYFLIQLSAFWHDNLHSVEKLIIMKTSKEIADVLNDLIEIHNDRIAGYEKAIRELKGEDDDLKILFASLISQNHKAKGELGTEVQVLGETMETGTTNRGKIYRAWMDVKAAFTSSSARMPCSIIVSMEKMQH